jgi:hypothetical protein
MPIAQINLRRFALVAILFAIVPVLRSQPSRSLQWNLEQQPTSAPCSSEDIAFVNAPEQVFLEKSYGLLPDFSFWKCDSIKATVFNEARVLIITRPSLIDDGETYTLIHPQGSINVRLLPLGGGLTFGGNTDNWHNRAAMNAILQTTKYGQPESIDWLALSLAYLTISDEAPNLADLHYAPGPTENFKSYTIPSFLRELPNLAKKHLLPTLKCDEGYCKVHFFYRTEPVAPLKVADFMYLLQDGTLSLLQANVRDYKGEGNEKKTFTSRWYYLTHFVF